MSEYFFKLDYWLFDLINQKGAFEYGDSFFPWVTDLHHMPYFKFVIVPLVLFLFWKAYRNKGIILFLGLLGALGFSDLSGSIIKNQALRLRPFENTELVATQKSPAGSKSFYSNHTSNMFTLAAYTGSFIPQIKIPIFIIAGVVGYSRVYNGVHYPSDVFTGLLMGVFWGQLFSWLGKKYILRISKKKDLA